MAQFENEHLHVNQAARTKQGNTNGHSGNKEASAAIDNIKIDTLRKDISQLQTQISTLARDVGAVGADQFSHATSYLNRSVAQLKDTGTDYMRKAEGRIKENPGQAISIAFAVGLLASYLIRRR